MPVHEREWSQNVQEFPLTLDKVIKDYTRLPEDCTDILYHYTNRTGLEGIIRSGGLRATHRIRMSDPGEFLYARDVVFECLDEILRRNDLPNVAESIDCYTRKNLERFLDYSIYSSAAYCACLTVNGDDLGQWLGYADDGVGFAMGINLRQFLNLHIPNVQNQLPYLYCAPVTYDEGKQRALVRCLVETGITDLQRFANQISNSPDQLTAMRDRITQEIVVHLMPIIEFVKSPKYSTEREVRLMLDTNDGTLLARNVQHFQRGEDDIPYIFMDMRSPVTRRLTLSKIRIGPKAPFCREATYVQNLLDDLNYGSGGYGDRPEIVRSDVVID